MDLEYGMELALRTLVAPLYMAARWVSPPQKGYHEDVPRSRMSAGLAAKIAIDELFFTAEMVSSSIVKPSERSRLRGEIQQALRLFEANGWLEQPEGYHRAPPRLDDPELRSAASRGLRFTHLSFESGYEPHPGEPGASRWLEREPNRTAHAWVMQHPGSPRPWIVCIHGYRMGTPLVDLVGFRAMWLHHNLGLNVILPVLPLHGPRTVGARSGDGFLTGDYVDTMHVQAQAMWDLRRILSWVRSQGAPGIAVYGLSLGGYTTAMLASLDGDLDCVIAGIPATDFVRLATSHLPGPVRLLAEFIGLDWEALRQMMRVVSPLALQPKVPWERRYIFAGARDRLVPPEHVVDLWHHWDRPRLLWYHGGHVSFRWERPVKKLVKDALRECGLIGGVREEPRWPQAASA